MPRTTPTTSELVLSVNAGSSSLKASLIQENHEHVASFLGERLSSDKAVLHFTRGGDTTSREVPDCDHEKALENIVDYLKEHGLLDQTVATGHRVVHGGDKFTESVLVDEEVLKDIESVSHLAPLHNPNNIKGIKALRKSAPSLPAVAVFDTSFHTSLPEKASTYPLPKRYREKGIKKYGFHGTSVRYVTKKAIEMLELKDSYNFIVCHLGNGASVTAVSDGKSVETSMGFSPLAGLMMGTRSGDVDPAIVSFAVESLGITIDQCMEDLNKESGLKAMVDTDDPDMRSITEKADGGNKQAKLAIEMYVYHVVKHIASSLVALPGQPDAIIFCGGVGEHSSKIRQACANCLQQTILPGFVLDENRNRDDGDNTKGVLSVEGSLPVCLQIATDEEAMIAHDCFQFVRQPSKQQN